MPSVIRSVIFPCDLDDILRSEAEGKEMSESDLIEELLEPLLDDTPLSLLANEPELMTCTDGNMCSRHREVKMSDHLDEKIANVAGFLTKSVSSVMVGLLRHRQGEWS